MSFIAGEGKKTRCDYEMQRFFPGIQSIVNYYSSKKIRRRVSLRFWSWSHGHPCHGRGAAEGWINIFINDMVGQGGTRLGQAREFPFLAHASWTSNIRQLILVGKIGKWKLKLNNDTNA